MADLISLLAGKRAPSDLSRVLRDLADAVDRNEVTDVVVAAMRNKNFEFIKGTSSYDATVLAALLQARSIEWMRE